MISDAEFLEQLQTAIRENRVTLPTLPEVALRVRDAVEQENSTARMIADMVATDVALSARLLQVANSPLYRGRVTVDNIQTAITRLGTKLVRNLVVSLAMKQIFQPTSDALDKRLRSIWEDSVTIAAISRALARQLPNLAPEKAMLGGLIHNIGALPILTMVDDIPEWQHDEKHLDQLLHNLNPIIGKQILNTWKFPQSLADIPTNSHNLEYDGGPEPNYVDVVIVARLQADPQVQQAAEAVGWDKIPAFNKIGLEPEISVIEIEDVAEEIEAAEQMLNT